MTEAISGSRAVDDHGPADRSPFDPPADEVQRQLATVTALVSDLIAGAHARPVRAAGASDEATHDVEAHLVTELLASVPPEQGRALDDALGTVRAVLATGQDNAAPGELAYIPGSGMLAASLGDLIAGAANRYTGLSSFTPAAVALEASVLRWLCELFALPDTAQGLLLSGGSAANLTALVAAREQHVADRPELGCVYVGEHAHASVRKAARIAGLRADQVRVCPSIDGRRLDVEAVRLAIKQDVADGLVPVAIVGAAGTTNTGAVDPLASLADLASDVGVWFHVDAAYGGFFQLTERGRACLAGIERADSITLDPHKSLFLPFGTGALLVRDRRQLAAAFAEDADYLRDAAEDPDGLPDLSSLSPELTREWRGLRLWLALQIHGVAAFRAALDRSLDLADHARRALMATPGLEVLGHPDLSIVTFRVDGDDADQDRALARINADGRVRLSSTMIDGRVVLRLAVLSHRTDQRTVDLALELISEAAQRS